VVDRPCHDNRRAAKGLIELHTTSSRFRRTLIGQIRAPPERPLLFTVVGELFLVAVVLSADCSNPAVGVENAGRAARPAQPHRLV
jgi:hypothetical protein